MRISDWSSDVCSSDLKVEKGTEGYDDKNRVAEYPTPNPASPGNKGWVLLSAGQYNTNPNATQGAGGASGVGAPAAQPGLFGRQPKWAGRRDGTERAGTGRTMGAEDKDKKRSKNV